MKSNQSKISCNRGFTLIELLVVVLIIGILAAVAVPQYKVAVARSRLANLQPLIKTIHEAEESYFLANGKYTDDGRDLDMQVACPHRIAAPNDYGVFQCDNYFVLDIMNGSQAYDYQRFIRAMYCPDVINTPSSAQCAAKADFIYEVYLDHSNKPYTIQCRGLNAFGRKVCKN